MFNWVTHFIWSGDTNFVFLFSGTKCEHCSVEMSTWISLVDPEQSTLLLLKEKEVVDVCLFTRLYMFQCYWWQSVSLIYQKIETWNAESSAIQTGTTLYACDKIFKKYLHPNQPVQLSERFQVCSLLATSRIFSMLEIPAFVWTPPTPPPFFHPTNEFSYFHYC